MSITHNNIYALWRNPITSKNKIKILLINELIFSDLYKLSFEYINRILNTSSYINTLVDDWHVEKLDFEMKFEQILKGIDVVIHSIRLHSDPIIYQYVSEEWMLKLEQRLNAQPYLKILKDKLQYNYPNTKKVICTSICKKNQTKLTKIELSTT